MRRLINNSFFLYLLKFGGLFLIFYLGTLLIIGLSSKENIYSSFVDDYLDFVSVLRYIILKAAFFLLSALNYHPIWIDQYTVGLKGGMSVRMVYSCVGYGVLSFWSAFILANHGTFLKKTVWLVGGWMLLLGINILRVVVLIVAINKNRAIAAEVDHHMVFNIVAYAFIFLLIYFYDRLQKRIPETASEV